MRAVADRALRHAGTPCRIGDRPRANASTCAVDRWQHRTRRRRAGPAGRRARPGARHRVRPGADRGRPRGRGRPRARRRPQPGGRRGRRPARRPALRRSVFDPLPGEGRWGIVLLLDGNVGIGGDPVALLRRRRLAAAPGRRRRGRGRGAGRRDRRPRRCGWSSAAGAGPWFPWARVGADRFADLARRAGLRAAGWLAVHEDGRSAAARTRGPWWRPGAHGGGSPGRSGRDPRRDDRRDAAPRRGWARPSGSRSRVCFATGVWSHLVQHPPALVHGPPVRPACTGSPRACTSITGTASIPLLLAKLWMVHAACSTWPPVRVGAPRGRAPRPPAAGRRRRCSCCCRATANVARGTRGASSSPGPTTGWRGSRSARWSSTSAPRRAAGRARAVGASRRPAAAVADRAPGRPTRRGVPRRRRPLAGAARPRRGHRRAARCRPLPRLSVLAPAPTRASAPRACRSTRRRSAPGSSTSPATRATAWWSRATCPAAAVAHARRPARPAAARGDPPDRLRRGVERVGRWRGRAACGTCWRWRAPAGAPGDRRVAAAVGGRYRGQRADARARPPTPTRCWRSSSTARRSHIDHGFPVRLDRAEPARRAADQVGPPPGGAQVRPDRPARDDLAAGPARRARRRAPGHRIRRCGACWSTPTARTPPSWPAGSSARPWPPTCSSCPP